MAHLFQVGAGSGGMMVLDIVCRDPRFTQVTLVEPDIFKPHNVERHLFPIAAIGTRKAELAADWLKTRRPDLTVNLIVCDLLDPDHAHEIGQAAHACDIGVCAADNESAKYHFDALMRRHAKQWTLGEVLSGGIGGFVHQFLPGGPCYGCVASFLRRSVTVDASKPPDYSAPGGPAPETTIPASRASISVIASLHAQITLQLLNGDPHSAEDFTSLLFTLKSVPGIFDEPFRAHRFRIARSIDCLICQDIETPKDLDQALDAALARLNSP